MYAATSRTDCSASPRQRATGLHIKIGVSPSVTEKPITILGSMGASTIKSKLGLSPLADAVMDAVQGGAARVFCIPVAASTAGTIGEVTKTGDGGGSVTVQGSAQQRLRAHRALHRAGRAQHRGLRLLHRRRQLLR